MEISLRQVRLQLFQVSLFFQNKVVAKPGSQTLKLSGGAGYPIALCLLVCQTRYAETYSRK